MGRDRGRLRLSHHKKGSLVRLVLQAYRRELRGELLSTRVHCAGLTPGRQLQDRGPGVAASRRRSLPLQNNQGEIAFAAWTVWKRCQRMRGLRALFQIVE